MKKAVIWSAGQVGISAMWHISLDYEIVRFVDSDVRKHTQGGGDDCSPINYNDNYYEVYSPARLKDLEFDKIFIANMNDYHIQ